jgi:hypothetical protein
MTICLNDDGEVLVRLKPHLPDKVLSAFDKEMKKKFNHHGEFEDEQQETKCEEKSFFYFFPNPEIENTRARCEHSSGE